jgi:transposase-like protein
MSGLQCKKRGSTNVKKNGRTPSGRQKYHCRVCSTYTTTDAAARERAAKMALVEQLHTERVSQRGIARLTRISRPTIIAYLKKTLPSARRNAPPDA